MGNPPPPAASQSNRSPRPLRHEQKFSRAGEHRARSEGVNGAGPEKSGPAMKLEPPFCISPECQFVTEVGAKIYTCKTRNEPPRLIQKSEIAVFHAHSTNLRSNGQFWLASGWFIPDRHFWRRWNAGCICHSGGCVRLNKFYSCFRLRGRWCLNCRNGVRARCSRFRQAPIFLLCSAATRLSEPTGETSLITSRREKSERKRTRSRNVLASRKSFGPTDTICGIVMPLSSSPPRE